MDVCLAASIISPGCDCHDVRSVDESLHPVCDLPSFMRSDSLQQQVALAVQLRLRDQSPYLMVQRPSQSVFPNWKEKDHVIVHRCHGANVTKYKRQSANCLSRATVPPTFHTVVTEVVMNSCGMIVESAVSVPFVTTLTIQNSLNIERSGRNTPGSVEQTTLRVAMTPSTTTGSGLQQVFGRVDH